MGFLSFWKSIQKMSRKYRYIPVPAGGTCRRWKSLCKCLDGKIVRLIPEVGAVQYRYWIWAWKSPKTLQASRKDYVTQPQVSLTMFRILNSWRTSGPRSGSCLIIATPVWSPLVGSGPKWSGSATVITTTGTQCFTLNLQNSRTGTGYTGTVPVVFYGISNRSEKPVRRLLKCIPVLKRHSL